MKALDYLSSEKNREGRVSDNFQKYLGTRTISEIMQRMVDDDSFALFVLDRAKQTINNIDSVHGKWGSISPLERMVNIMGNSDVTYQQMAIDDFQEHLDFMQKILHSEKDLMVLESMLKYYSSLTNLRIFKVQRSK